MDLDVSENGGFSPTIIHFNREFHSKSSILGGNTPIFGNIHIDFCVQPIHLLPLQLQPQSIALRQVQLIAVE